MEKKKKDWEALDRKQNGGTDHTDGRGEWRFPEGGKEYPKTK